MTAACPLLLRVICPCHSRLSTDYCLSPCCHTLRRCSSIVRALCLRSEKWDHYPPAVSTRKSYWRLTVDDCINRVSLRSLEMASQQHLDTSAAEKDSSRSAGLLETRRGSTEPPSTLDPTTPIISIRNHLASIVNRELEEMERGEIDERSTQHNDMLHQLASLSVSSSASVSLSESERSNPVSSQPVPTYAGVLSAPKAVTFTPTDVRSLPCLTGSAVVDVAELLSQFRLVVGFRAKAVAPQEDR